MSEPGKQDEVIQEILQYQIDGVVLASVTLSSHIAEECADLGVPMVLFNRYIPDAHASSVISNNIAGGRQLAKFLVDNGHQRIAYIAGQENSSTNVEREQGFREGLRNAGMELWQYAVGNYVSEEAAVATRSMLSNGELPDAVFVANDHMAFTVMDVMRSEFNISVPETISVVGYDNVPEAAWPAYNLTTFEQPLDVMITDTVDILLEQMEYKKVTAEQRIAEGRLIVRKSARILNKDNH